MYCLNCRFENPPGFNFCGKCGAVLTEVPPESKKEEAERRQITVMFCDLVGFTSLSEEMDPEELRDLVSAYQSACAEIIYRYEGYIAQYLGDGLLIYFGYPFAHEDDAIRAVRAGLEIVSAIDVIPLPGRLLPERIKVRIGIHTGLVVLGEVGIKERPERLALGDTPSIASRLQGLAEPNTVVISSTTFGLVQGYFNCEDLGIHMLKGITKSIHTYRVKGETGTVSRFDASVARGLTPLIGRQEELNLLIELWGQVCRGNEWILLFTGEAGIGKSRLLYELKKRIAHTNHTVLECQCLQYYQNSAFHPVIDLIERILKFRRDDSAEEKFNKLAEAIHRLPLPEEMILLFSSFLSLPVPGRYSKLNLAPQKQRQKTLEALISWLERIAEKRPLLFLVEDLHWADPSTLEFLSLFMKQKLRAPILAVFTFRPEFNPDWPLHSHITKLNLLRLKNQESEAMAELIAGGKMLPIDLMRQIVAKSDGIPLYVEEITKMVIESCLHKEGKNGLEITESLPKVLIPTTLQDSLMARLDRLSPIKSSGTIKEVAQIGATIGREFRYDLLKDVSSLDDVTLQRELSGLVELRFFTGVVLPLTAIFSSML